jgi:DNA-binding MarR family transcriptional regulator
MTETSDASDAELPWYDQVGLPVLLRAARNVYAAEMRRAFGEAGFEDLPRNGAYVLGATDNGAPLGVIIRELAVSKQAAGQLVDTLVLRGYLTREVDPEDRRRLNLALTERGRAANAVTQERVQALEAELLALVPEKALAATRKTLAALASLGEREEETAQA